MNPPDTWRMLLTEKEIQTVVRKIAAEINLKFKDTPVILTCILKGAAWFLVDLTRHLTIPYTTSFLEARSYHDNQTQSDEIEILSNIDPKILKGRTIILLDELFDNGKTLREVKNKLGCLQAENVLNGLPLNEKNDIFTCTLFIKDKPVNTELPNLSGITIPDVWVVGYGLDDQEEKRGWPALYACPKMPGIPNTKDDDLFISKNKYQEICIKLYVNINK